MRRHGNILVLDAYVQEVFGAEPGGLAEPLSGVTYKVGVYGNTSISVTRRPDDAQFSEVNGYAAELGALCQMRINLTTNEATVWGLLERPKFKQCTPPSSLTPQAASLVTSEQLRMLLNGGA